MSGISQERPISAHERIHEHRPISETDRTSAEEIANRDLRLGFGAIGACVMAALVITIIVSL